MNFFDALSKRTEGKDWLKYEGKYIGVNKSWFTSGDELNEFIMYFREKWYSITLTMSDLLSDKWEIEEKADRIN